MEDEAESQLENHCIVVPVRNTPEHLVLNAKRMEEVSEMRKGSSTMTHFPPHLLICYGIKHVTSSQPSMQYIIFPIFNSQSGAGHHPNKVSSEYQAQITVVL